MKILGIGSKLLDGVVVAFTNSRDTGVTVLVKTTQNKIITWTQKEVEDYVSNN